MMEVLGYLENGNMRNINVIVDDDIIQQDKLGLKTFDATPFKCGKCHQSIMCLALNYGKYVMFCANESCLKFDTERTKEIELKKWISRNDLYNTFSNER